MMIVQVHHNRVLGDCKTQCRRPFKVRFCSKKKSIGNYYILQPQKELQTKSLQQKNFFKVNIFFSLLHFDFDKTQKPQRSLDRRKANQNYVFSQHCNAVCEKST